jgi:hypothetical protein
MTPPPMTMSTGNADDQEGGPEVDFGRCHKPGLGSHSKTSMQSAWWKPGEFHSQIAIAGTMTSANADMMIQATIVAMG